MGSSVSRPGMPMGILVQSPPHIAFCSRVKLQVSVDITDTSPSASPCQSRSESSFFLICGQVAKRWPSGRAKTESSSTRYCGQVSDSTLTPRSCAARTMSAPAPVDMWTTYRVPPVTSHQVMARWMASYSVNCGRVMAWSWAPYFFISSGWWWRSMSSSRTRAVSACTISIPPRSRSCSSVQ